MTSGQSHVHRSPPIRIGTRTVEFQWRVSAPAGLEHHSCDPADLEHEFSTVWGPSPPSRWKRTHLEVYRRARNTFLTQVSKRLGLMTDPILIDRDDPDEGVDAPRQAAEVLLAAQRAGVTIGRDGAIHGDPDIVDAWIPSLRQHEEGIVSLLSTAVYRCAVCGESTKSGMNFEGGPLCVKTKVVPLCKPCWLAGENDAAVREKVIAAARVIDTTPPLSLSDGSPP